MKQICLIVTALFVLKFRVFAQFENHKDILEDFFPRIFVQMQYKELILQNYSCDSTGKWKKEEAYVNYINKTKRPRKYFYPVPLTLERIIKDSYNVPHC